MQDVYFVAEESATSRGFVGLVIDASTHRTVMRTATLYTSKELARVAARQMWRERQEVAA